MNMDRFSDSCLIPDPQEAKPIAKCSVGDSVFYSLDEPCYVIDGKLVHPDEVRETTVGEALEVTQWGA